MFRPSQDARQYAYDRLHALIHGSPNQRNLSKYVDHKPISLSVFNITNPEHLCDAAYFGIPLLPHDEKSFKACVAVVADRKLTTGGAAKFLDWFMP